MADLWLSLLQLSREARAPANLFNPENVKTNGGNEKQPTTPAIITEEEEAEFLYTLEFDTTPRINTIKLYSDSAENDQSSSRSLEKWSFRKNKTSYLSSSSNSSVDNLELDSGEEESDDDCMSSSEDVPLIMTREMRVRRKQSSSSSASSLSSSTSEGTQSFSRRLSRTSTKGSISTISSPNSITSSKCLSSVNDKESKTPNFSLSRTFRNFFRRNKDSSSDANMNAGSSEGDQNRDDVPRFSIDATDVFEDLESNIEYQLLSELSFEETEEQTLEPDEVDGKKDIGSVIFSERATTGPDEIEGTENKGSLSISERLLKIFVLTKQESSGWVGEVVKFDSGRFEVPLPFEIPGEKSSCSKDAVRDCRMDQSDSGQRFSQALPGRLTKVYLNLTFVRQR